jgi:hypothetical protein
MSKEQKTTVAFRQGLEVIRKLQLLFARVGGYQKTTVAFRQGRRLSENYSCFLNFEVMLIKKILNYF